MTIKERREELGKTQAELAEELDVNQAAVSNWELGKFSPLRKMHGRIARALHCDVQDLDFNCRK